MLVFVEIMHKNKIIFHDITWKLLIKMRNISENYIHTELMYIHRTPRATKRLNAKEREQE